METLPLVDLSRISQTKFNNEEFSDASRQLGQALREVGFVYIVNHGISSEKVDAAFLESKKFFELPSETKLKYVKKCNENDIKEYHGYTPTNPTEDLDTTGELELREKYDLKPGCLRFPDEDCPGLGPSMLSLELACRPLIIKLLRMLAHSLNLPDLDVFVKGTKCILDPCSVPSFTSFSSMYYPKIKEELNIRSGMVRCREHTDWGSITLLFQDSIGGLEVKRADGQWIPATPIPGSILINTGQMLEIWSHGIFRATFHRVLIPEAEIKRRTHRQSIAYFVLPDDETRIAPITIIMENTGELSSYIKYLAGMTAFEIARKKIQREIKY